MLRPAIAIVLSVYFFLGSTLLPKGDFALITDLPAMYHQYTLIDDPQDISVIDFVFDYLLNGEALLENDVYKGHPVPYASVQFQHQANLLSFVIAQWAMPFIGARIISREYHLQNDIIGIQYYTPDIFRPPLA